MYFVQCNDYPKCINNINDLEKDTENVFKAQDFGDFQFYSKQYEPKTKYNDLSPYGYTQNLLYVYCPEDSVDGYCQFEILVYSDYEEIVIPGQHLHLSQERTAAYEGGLPADQPAGVHQRGVCHCKDCWPKDVRELQPAVWHQLHCRDAHQSLWPQ